MILDKIAASTRLRVAKARATRPLEEIRERALSLPKGVKGLERTLGAEGLSYICEVKRASPSKGMIAPDFPYLSIARDYEAAGAAAVSVLTEPEYFLGRDEYLAEIVSALSIPALRKDFTVDEYQLYEAKLLGADAVLLICALLDRKTIGGYLSICEELGLSALVETHDEAELADAVGAGARVIGVNNRNLKTFEVDFGTCLRLRDKTPPGVLFVAESGIKTHEDIVRLKKAGVDGALIGEALMRSPDKKAALALLDRGEA